jgi:N-methylhydantoinase B
VDGKWGEVHVPPQGRPRVAVPEWWIVSDFVQSGGGFGDPLDREPDEVARDVASGIYTEWAADRFFGVPMNGDAQAVERRRGAIRETRRARGKPVGKISTGKVQGAVVARPHASVEAVRVNGRVAWRCARCGQDLGDARANYKEGTLRVVEPLGEVSELALPAGEFIGELHEYCCPGCLTLLQVDICCPALDGDAVVHDIALDLVAS